MCDIAIPAPPMPGSGGLPANPIQALVAAFQALASAPTLDGLPHDPPSGPAPAQMGSGGLPANPIQAFQSMLDAMTPPDCPTE